MSKKFYTLKVVGKEYAEVTTDFVEHADQPSATGTYRGKKAEENAKKAIAQTPHDYEIIRI